MLDFHGSSTRSGAAMAMVAMALVQLGVAASVGLFDQVGPEGAVWLRLVWAGPILLMAARPWQASLTRSQMALCITLGVATAGMTMLFMAAVARLPLGTASALQFLGPLGVAVGHGRGPARLWAVAGGVGVCLLTEPWRGGADLLGVALALGSAACWAAYIVLTQRAGDQLSGLRALAISMPVAAAVATLAVGPDVFGHLTPELMLIGLGLALLLPVVPFSLELLALRRLSATAFGTLMSLEPAIAVLVGLAVLRQGLEISTSMGIVLVVAAGIGAIRSGARIEEGARPPSLSPETPRGQPAAPGSDPRAAPSHE